MSAKSLYQFNFTDTQRLNYALARLETLGFPKSSLIQVMLVLHVTEEASHLDKKLLTDTVKDAGGVPVFPEKEPEDLLQSAGGGVFEFAFGGEEEALRTKAMIEDSLSCKDHSAIKITNGFEEAVLRIDPNHYFYDRSTLWCQKAGKGHKDDWSTLLRIIQGCGGLPVEKFREEKRRLRQEDSDKETKNQELNNQRQFIEDEARKTIRSSRSVSRFSMFKFESSEYAHAAMGRIIALGVRGDSIKSQLMGYVLIKKNDVDQYWQTILAIVEQNRGKKVRSTDMFKELVDANDQAFTKIRFSDDEDLQKMKYGLVEAGLGEDDFEESDRILSIKRRCNDTLIKLQTTIRSNRGHLLTSVGEYLVK